LFSDADLTGQTLAFARQMASAATRAMRPIKRFIYVGFVQICLLASRSSGEMPSRCLLRGTLQSDSRRSSNDELPRRNNLWRDLTATSVRSACLVFLAAWHRAL
jgi:hypothetical protein